MSCDWTCHVCGMIVKDEKMYDMPEPLSEAWAVQVCRMYVCEREWLMMNGGMVVEMYEVAGMIRIVGVVASLMSGV